MDIGIGGDVSKLQIDQTIQRGTFPVLDRLSVDPPATATGISTKSNVQHSRRHGTHLHFPTPV